MTLSLSDIHLGYVHPTKGYLKHKTISDANNYEVLNPGTKFIFIDGNQKVRYLTIDEVNNLSIADLLRTDPCVTRPQPCGPPTLRFYGGRGVGAEANPVIDRKGQIIALDLVSSGVGYSSPPRVKVTDPCKNGTGASFEVEIKNGQVEQVIPKDTGFGYLPPQPASPTYPALVKLKEVRVANRGFNYECGKDKLTITPNNGTVLSYTCTPFGQIQSVKVENGGNFTELPKITIPSSTGLNARFTPVFEIIRDPLTPEVARPEDIVQVFDLVGLNLNGYVDGRTYYGNVYFSDGVKYAGTRQSGRAPIRVYDTLQDSITYRSSTDGR